MPKVKQIEVNERELEHLLVQDPEVIEEGMRILGHQLQTDSGRLDILASDIDNVLCIIELKTTIDEKQLDQGLGYYDWARTNIQGISIHYPDKIDVNQEPRLILIAPDFSESIKRIAKYINVPLDLKEYQALELPNGEKDVLCRSIEIIELLEPSKIPTFEENLNYIENEEVRNLCNECINQLKEMGIELRPRANHWFTVWYETKRFMKIVCKKQFFACIMIREDGTRSERKRISTKTDWNTILKEEIIPAYKKLGGTTTNITESDDSQH